MAVAAQQQLRQGEGPPPRLDQIFPGQPEEQKATVDGDAVAMIAEKGENNQSSGVVLKIKHRLRNMSFLCLL
jgi:hypothetical protein